MTDQLGFAVKMEQSYGEAIAIVIDALKAEGFGVLTEIDVKSTLKEKLGQEFRPYVILGACNPSLAYQALSSQPEVGMMLPCNVTVEADVHGGALVHILDPKMMMRFGMLGKNPVLQDVANKAHEKLARVAKSLES
jgi:uncharacterized protein (DUF302 family)